MASNASDASEDAADWRDSRVQTCEHISEIEPRKKTVIGGYTCCVPGCYSNTKRDQELSFHKFPKDESMKQKWINAIKRKDFIPGELNRVCSLHFQGGRKMDLTDVPAIFLLLSQPKSRKPSKEHEPLPTPAKRKIPLEDAVLEGVENEDDERIRMKQKIDLLRKQIQVEKFGLQQFCGSDSDIRFYAGFPDYNTLTSLYEFLGPAVTKLNYWGSKAVFHWQRSGVIARI